MKKPVKRPSISRGKKEFLALLTVAITAVTAVLIISNYNQLSLNMQSQAETGSFLGSFRTTRPVAASPLVIPTKPVAASPLLKPLKPVAASPLVKPRISPCLELQTKIKASQGTDCGVAKYNSVADVNKDKKINQTDLNLLTKNLRNEDWCRRALIATRPLCSPKLK